MLERILLKFTEGTSPLSLPTQSITVFVGPNNSGKSLVLREIEDAISSNPKPGDAKIFDDYEIVWPTKDEIDRDLAILSKNPPPGLGEGHVYIGRIGPEGKLEAHSFPSSALYEWARDHSNKQHFSAAFLKYMLIRLDGRTRFSLTNDRSTGDLLTRPTNILAHLFTDDSVRAKVHDLIHDAFGVYLVVDPLSGGTLRIRLSREAPQQDEQSLNQLARTFHSQAMYIKDASDGVQAYVGIIIAVLAGEYRAILIDEPEAFLHPPLARKLRYQLPRLHSKGVVHFSHRRIAPTFSLGASKRQEPCALSGWNIQTENRRGELSIPPPLKRCSGNPLMRSANVISALFHDGVVVTESDNDRAFYAEIYYRMAETAGELPSLLFVNAQNKQTIKDVIAPLRGFGIPAAAIADIDILKDGGRVWTDWMKAAHIPEPLRGGLSAQRSAIEALFAGKDMKRDGGVEGQVRELLDILTRVASFVDCLPRPAMASYS